MAPLAAAAASASSTPPAAYVYCGPGAGTRSVLSTIHSLREALLASVKVGPCSEAGQSGSPCCPTLRGPACAAG